jgi:hypothetical protein
VLALGPSRKAHSNKTRHGESVDLRNGKYQRRGHDLVAQLVEQYTFNVRAARSSRAGITKEAQESP